MFAGEEFPVFSFEDFGFDVEAAFLSGRRDTYWAEVSMTLTILPLMISSGLLKDDIYLNQILYTFDYFVYY